MEMRKLWLYNFRVDFLKYAQLTSLASQSFLSLSLTFLLCQVAMAETIALISNSTSSVLIPEAGKS